jgi:hypothetical protein
LSRRAIALFLLLVAGGIWLAAGEPARRARDRARADYARAREDRERQRVHLTALERQAAPAPEAGAAGVRALRRALLDPTRGLSLSGVAVEATGTARGAARGRLRAEGRTADVLALAERLAGPGSSVRLEQVQIAPGVGDEEELIRFSAEVTSSGGRR